MIGSNIFSWESIDAEYFPDSKVRVKLATGDNMQLIWAEFQPGGRYDLHSHAREQFSLMISGRMKLTVGDETREIGPGEMWHAPSNVMHGGEILGDEPVVYSGDTVRLDEDGDLWFVGRQDAMIKTSGFRVSPEEVEDLVYRSGAVAEAVAFGMADAELGETVHVAITPADSDIDEERLLRHCRKVMPGYMVPRRFHLWRHAMPRTASGKLDRPAVVKHCRSQGAPDEAEHAGTDNRKIHKGDMVL